MKSKYLSYIFAAAAVLLSDVMCAVTAYGYCDMLWGVRCGGYSAPAETAFLLAIPYAVGIVICAFLAWFFRIRSRGSI